MVQLLVLAAELPLTLKEVNIEDDENLHRRYLERIPVLQLDGEEISDFFVDEVDLRRRVLGAGT
jgi:hypothetical protein